MTIQGQRSRDRVQTICALTDEEAKAFAQKWGIPKWTSDTAEAIEDPETDLVIVGLPNNLHKKAVLLVAAAEDSGIGLIRFENQAIGQFEVSWTFRDGMDLRDEVAGTEGTIWLNHFLRTGYEMFTAAGRGGYVAEKAESEKGWLFPVGDEVHELGYVHMFSDMFDALDEGREPMETFLDAYIVNAIVDACYRSAKTKRWEPVKLERWYKAGKKKKAVPAKKTTGKKYARIKEERMPDGKIKQILRDRKTGKIIQKVKIGQTQ